MRWRFRTPNNVSRRIIVWLICLAMVGATAGTLLAWVVPPDEITAEESE